MTENGLWKEIWKPITLDFEYTFRSSVEHYYPQNPIEGNLSIALNEEQKHRGQVS